MTVIEKRLVQAYATLVMAGRKQIEEIPDTEIVLESGERSTMHKEIEVEIANRIIQKLEPANSF